MMEFALRGHFQPVASRSEGRRYNPYEPASSPQASWAYRPEGRLRSTDFSIRHPATSNQYEVSRKQ